VVSRFQTLPFLLGAVAVVPFAWSADVAIDIGHTLEKPGAISAAGIPEFEFNRLLAQRLGERLEAASLSVRLINRDGKVASLESRTAQAANDRLFVSIHHDSVKAKYRPVKDARFQGFSFWLSESGVAPAQSLRCAKAMADRLLAAGFQPSHYHADPVDGENRAVIDWSRGIFANQGLAVLRTARQPAVLIEAGVIAHPIEEQRLATPVVRESIAAALADGIVACLGDKMIRE
jgi:N-acetylmuramoyl-L-alanine amidase